jgi:beta propeller repeat protein
MICAQRMRSGVLTAVQASLFALVLASCTRQVTVDDGQVASPSVAAPVAPPPAGAGAPTSAGAGGAGDPPPVAPPGVDAPTAVPLADAGMAGSAASTSVMDGIDQAGGADSLIDTIEVLAVFLSAIELPAVGSAGVSIVQYFGSNQAATLYVDWNGVAEFWHLDSGAHYVGTAASGDRHLGLVYAPASYGIYSGDDAGELSGTPGSYKEHLAAGADGFAWVDYPTPASGARPGGGAMPPPVGGDMQDPGEVVFQRWRGARSTLSDRLRYRARLDLSQTHVAFVEYADTAAGSVGQIVVLPLAGGTPIIAAPSSNHQDRPAIDGDWVVWEEYLSDQDSVIRARNLATGEVRDVSSSMGFRTNPDILGTRVVWEDQRSGDGDLYVVDLAQAGGERVVVSGAGHSAAVRLSPSGVVWVETADDVIALLSARWLE